MFEVEWWSKCECDIELLASRNLRYNFWEFEVLIDTSVIRFESKLTANVSNSRQDESFEETLVATVDVQKSAILEQCDQSHKVNHEQYCFEAL